MLGILPLLLIGPLGFLAPAYAESAEATDAPGPVKHALGVGMGLPSLLHLDYQRWFSERSSIDVSLTPLLLHNVLVVSYKHHIELKTSTKGAHNLLVSGGYMGIANLGFVFNGVGAGAGYEYLGESVGISGVAGVFINPFGDNPTSPIENIFPQVHVTVWFLRRRGD